MCGNRFIVSNAHVVPITVTYRVSGSEEEGTAKVDAAPAEDPAVSEQMFETRAGGNVQIFLDGKPLVTRANGGTPCTPVVPAPSFAVASGTESGQWTAPVSWPIVAVHMALLPSGQVLSIGRKGTPQVWDPGTGVFTAVPSPAWLFCAGHALLSDGRLLIAGGHITDGHGLPNITFFSGTNNTWSTGSPMANGRWYPTTTVMGNGDVVILAGRDQSGTVVTVPEVWSNGTVRQLTGAKQSLPYYPRAFLAPDGLLYSAGPPSPRAFSPCRARARGRRGRRGWVAPGITARR